MALSHARVVVREKTPFAHEERAVDFALGALPDRDPFHAWALVELLDPSTGGLHEIDLIVLGYGALYVVEIKSFPGRIEGDGRDWIWTPPGEHARFRDSPRPLNNRKAKILASQLQRQLPAGTRSPWVESLVFLSDPDVDTTGLTPEGKIGVVTRDSFERAITHGEVPGLDPQKLTRRIDRPTMRAVIQGLSKLGLRPRKARYTAGQYELGEILGETDTFQDRLATHNAIAAQSRRARTYLVPEQTSVEKKQQLRRAADREAQLLYEVEHPHILRYTDYVPGASITPAAGARICSTLSSTSRSTTSTTGIPFCPSAGSGTPPPIAIAPPSPSTSS